MFADIGHIHVVCRIRTQLGRTSINIADAYLQTMNKTSSRQNRHNNQRHGGIALFSKMTEPPADTVLTMLHYRGALGRTSTDAGERQHHRN
ncbi:hypothetical protein D3C85_1479020 [compost metagenome]